MSRNFLSEGDIKKPAKAGNRLAMSNKVAK